MKAVVRQKYGSPDVLKLEEVEKPLPKANEVLVKIHAASVNALDWHILRGAPFFARLMFGFFTPKNKILGYDIAGHVEAVGKDVTLFRAGDEVYGGLGFVLGGFAEYACIAEDAFVALKPRNITFEEAAAVPVAAVTALIGLRAAKIQSGQKVLINGSAGGVGTFTVQIAKSFGAEVTGVCSTRNLELVRSIGADHVIDYTRDDFTRTGRSYDLVVDNVGNRSVFDLRRTLNPNGTCIVLGFTSVGRLLQHSIVGPLLAKTGSKMWVSSGSVKPAKEHLTFLNQLLEAKKVVPVIDRRYPLAQVPEAMKYIETGHARAKIVITAQE